MRTTITLRDELVKTLKRRAVESGRPFRVVLEETIDRGLEARSAPRRRFRVRAFNLGGPLPGVDLVKALTLAGELEDQETLRKIELGK